MKTFFEWAKKNKTKEIIDDENQENCSQCDGPLEELGALGNLMHFRCQNCGAMSSIKK